MEKLKKQDVTQSVQSWVEAVILGLNLCPFAHDIWKRGDWSIEVDLASDKGQRFDWTKERIEQFVLDSKARNEGEMKGFTTLLVYPLARENFIKFYNFSAMIEDMLLEMGLKDHIQLVTFHPEFRFEGEKRDARGNFVNRSPFPLLHLLWAGDVTDVIEKFGENIGQKVAQENNNKLSSMTDNDFEEKVLKYVRSSWEVEKLDG